MFIGVEKRKLLSEIIIDHELLCIMAKCFYFLVQPLGDQLLHVLRSISSRFTDIIYVKWLENQEKAALGKGGKKGKHFGLSLDLEHNRVISMGN